MDKFYPFFCPLVHPNGTLKGTYFYIKLTNIVDTEASSLKVLETTILVAAFFIRILLNFDSDLE